MQTHDVEPWHDGLTLFPSAMSSWALLSSWQLGLLLGGAGITYAAALLLGRIVFPTIITYPWTDCKSREDQSSTVVVAGSYNPPHHGHLAVLAYLSQRYGRVIVAIGVNPNKKYLVTPDERAALLRRMLAPYKNVQVEGKSEWFNLFVTRDQLTVLLVIHGYIWRTVKRMNAKIFFRGIRSWEKDGQEERALQILNTWGPLLLGPLWWPLPTIFIEGKPEYNHVSSTLIRSLCKDGKAKNEDLRTLVPEVVLEDVVRLYGRQ